MQTVKKKGYLGNLILLAHASATEAIVLNDDKRKDLMMIDPRKIGRNPNNHRHIDVKDEDMQELIASIRANGIITPLMLKNNPEFGKTEDAPEYISYAGNRRITAVQYLIDVEGMEIKYVPAQVKKNVTLETEFLTQLIENSGKPFTFLEKAEVIRELVEVCQWTPADIRNKTGETEAAISNYLTVATKFNKKQKAMINNNDITATLALQILRESDTPEEFEGKMDELFTQAQELRASGAKKDNKRATITHANAKNVLVKKKVIDILEETCLKIDQKQLTGEKATFLLEVTALLRKQDKNTISKIMKLVTAE